jgi:hypothetical protein
MHCLMSLSSQRWLCALSGSVPGGASEFRDVHKALGLWFGRCPLYPRKRTFGFAICAQPREGQRFLPPSCTVFDARHAIVESRSHRRRCSLWWRKSLPLGEHTVMEVFLIGLALIAGVGVAFFLFVIEPRRKIYDYDPRDLR